MEQHLAVLRGYAHQVFGQGETLTAHEEEDKARRMTEFLAIGGSFKLTIKEMVDQVYRDTFVMSYGCGCPSCRARH